MDSVSLLKWLFRRQMEALRRDYQILRKGWNLAAATATICVTT